MLSLSKRLGAQSVLQVAGSDKNPDTKIPVNPPRVWKGDNSRVEGR